MKLSNDDVNEILQLLDAGSFHELNLQTLRFKLLLRRDGEGDWTQSVETLTTPNVLHIRPGELPASKAVAPARNERTDMDHLFAVRAPLLGTFYRAPKPGSPPFVEVGSQVEKDTLVGIIETMKLMNSVYAGATGKVVEICYKDAEFVEKDAALMYIEEEPAK